MTKIGLDAGHGLFTKGKQTPTGIKEWTLNDDVCDRIQAKLNNYDCEVIRTDHNEGKVDEPLSQRVNEYLKAGVECFVSIHHNAYTNDWNEATGVEVYTDRIPIAADNKLANLIYQKITTYTGLKGRGIKRRDFQVINQNKVPAVLVEGGFMDSTIDYSVITSEEGKEAYANAVFESLVEFCKLKRKTTTPAPQLAPSPAPVSQAEEITVTYQVYDHAKKKFLPNVTSGQIAGNKGNAIDAIKISLSRGNIWCSVHVPLTKKKAARWLPEVKNREDYAGNIGQAFDGIKLRTDTGKKLCYAARVKKTGKFLPTVTGCSTTDKKNGYAGNLSGQEIDGIKIWFE